MKVHRRIVFVGCCMLWSCSAILGTKDIYLVTGDDGGGDPDASLDAAADGPATPGRDAAGTPDTGTCATADTTSSPLHCGRCGHSCLGGTCKDSKCQPVPIVTGTSVRDIAIDKDHVYWIEPGTSKAMQANKDGTGAIQLGGGTINLLVGLGIDGANVYWGSHDDIVLRCTIGGCKNTPTVVSNGVNAINGVAVDGTNVFWLEAPGGVSKVQKVPKGATMTTGQNVATGTAAMGDFSHPTTDGTYVYWAADDGMVRRAPSAGGAVTVVGKGTGAAGGLFVDDTNIYWSVSDTPGGVINVAPKTGATLGSPIAVQQDLPLGVTADVNSVYWVTAGGIGGTSGTVMTCAIAKCVPTALAQGQRTPASVAVDDTAIYWSNFDLGNSQGGIMRLAK